MVESESATFAQCRGAECEVLGEADMQDLYIHVWKFLSWCSFGHIPRGSVRIELRVVASGSTDLGVGFYAEEKRIGISISECGDVVLVSTHLPAAFWSPWW